MNQIKAFATQLIHSVARSQADEIRRGLLACPNTRHIRKHCADTKTIISITLLFEDRPHHISLSCSSNLSAEKMSDARRPIRFYELSYDFFFFLLFRTSGNILLCSLTRLTSVLFQRDLPRRWESEPPSHLPPAPPPPPPPHPLLSPQLSPATQKRWKVYYRRSNSHNLHRQLLCKGQSGTGNEGSSLIGCVAPPLSQELGPKSLHQRQKDECKRQETAETPGKCLFFSFGLAECNDKCVYEHNHHLNTLLMTLHRLARGPESSYKQLGGDWAWTG